LTQPHGSPDESREEQRRLRRLYVTARSLLQVAEEADDERELIMTIIQAAAIWHEVDARAYRRDLHGRFVVDVRLPGADLSLGPRDFSAFSVLSGPVTRITSLGEQEQPGWSLSGELALLPIGASSQTQPRWVLAIPIDTDATVSSNLLLLCEVLGLCLDRISTRREHDLRRRLTQGLADREAPVADLANAALAQILTFLGAAQGRLVTGAGGAGEGAEGAETRTMAAAGGEWTAGAPPRLEPGQSLMTPRRLTMTFSVGSQAIATIDLVAPEGSEFGITDVGLLESAVGVMRVWLAGVLDGTAAQPAEGEPAAGFETRIDEELARAQRLPAETGVVMIDLAPGAQRREVRVRAAVPNPVVRQLRASDVLGRLKDGEICALLSNTTADGSAAAAARLHQNLQALAEQHNLPDVMVGATTLLESDETVADVLARAREDARRRGAGPA
jgi:GGDEF domain-containing protein